MLLEKTFLIIFSTIIFQIFPYMDKNPSIIKKLWWWKKNLLLSTILPVKICNPTLWYVHSFKKQKFVKHFFFLNTCKRNDKQSESKPLYNLKIYANHSDIMKNWHRYLVDICKKKLWVVVSVQGCVEDPIINFCRITDPLLPELYSSGPLPMN